MNRIWEVGRDPSLEMEITRQGWDSRGDDRYLLAVSPGVLVRIGFGLHATEELKKGGWYQRVLR